MSALKIYKSKKISLKNRKYHIEEGCQNQKKRKTFKSYFISEKSKNPLISHLSIKAYYFLKFVSTVHIEEKKRKEMSVLAPNAIFQSNTKSNTHFCLKDLHRFI